jgi:hypothetical protein
VTGGQLSCFVTVTNCGVCAAAAAAAAHEERAVHMAGCALWLVAGSTCGVTMQQSIHDPCSALQRNSAWRCLPKEQVMLEGDFAGLCSCTQMHNQNPILMASSEGERHLAS